MLIHPWDAALEPAEWQAWVRSTDRFGMLGELRHELSSGEHSERHVSMRDWLDGGS